MSLKYYLEIAAKGDFDKTKEQVLSADYSKTIDGVEYEFQLSLYPDVKSAMSHTNLLKSYKQDSAILRVDFIADGDTELTGKGIPLTIFSYLKGAVDSFLKRKAKVTPMVWEKDKMVKKEKPAKIVKIAGIMVVSEKDMEAKRASAYEKLLAQIVREKGGKIANKTKVNTAKWGSGTLFMLENPV